MAKHNYFLIITFFLIFSAFIYYKFFRHSTTPILISSYETVFPQPSVIQKDTLPNIHLIKTAFIPQAPEKNWDEPWQDSCEEAALLTVYYFYQNQNPDTPTIVKDLEKMFSFESTQNWTSDINVTQMATISAKLWNYRPLVLENPTLADFKKYLSQNIPIIVPANGKILYTENSHFKGGGPWYHNLVILGYNDNKKQFTVHDVGTQFGAYFHYSYSTLMKSIHDFPPTLKKEDINSGIPRALILLK